MTMTTSHREDSVTPHSQKLQTTGSHGVWMTMTTSLWVTSHSQKLQTTGSHSVCWRLSHQRSHRVELHHWARCTQYPWRQCSMTTDMEAVTHALHWTTWKGNRPHMPSSILTDSTSLLQTVEWETQTGMRHCLILTLENSCGCTALDMPQWRDIMEQKDGQAKQPSKVAFISEDLKCFDAWDITCGHKANITCGHKANITCGHKGNDIALSIAWRTEQRERSIQQSSLKGQEKAIINHINIRSVNRNTGETSERQGETDIVTC